MIWRLLLVVVWAGWAGDGWWFVLIVWFGGREGRSWWAVIAADCFVGVEGWTWWCYQQAWGWGGAGDGCLVGWILAARDSNVVWKPAIVPAMVDWKVLKEPIIESWVCFMAAWLSMSFLSSGVGGVGGWGVVWVVSLGFWMLWSLGVLCCVCLWMGAPSWSWAGRPLFGLVDGWMVGTVLM